MNPYRSILNAQGFKALTQPADLPDVRLGVGEAETQKSLGLKLQYRPNKRPAVMPADTETPYELSTVSIPKKLGPDDFPTDSFYLGPSIGGY